MEKVLTEQQGKTLVQIARNTIAQKLGVQTEEIASEKSLPDTEYGTFVTLKIDGQLRGCIGNLQVAGSVAASVQRNALSAAFHDSRFSPLTEAELAAVEIDISVLSTAQKLEYNDGADLLSKLRPGIDGVILRYGTAGATFLPQVWGQLPTPEQFMGHLCRKAGLSESAWRDVHLDIEIYQVQCFEEEKA
jgi:AmmeMemoRadiSam system protein A